MSEPKRGRTQGRRRNVVSVSLGSDDLLFLDRLGETLARYYGRPMNRSKVIRRLIGIAVRINAGYEVRNLV